MSKRKLLLADDSVTIQKVVNLTFADEGIEVISVGDGDTAMAKVFEISPDLVMADVNMPGLSGYQICEQIRQSEAFRQTPVILLVGSFEPFDEDEARRVGADDFLTKPFQSIRQLVNKVTVLLNSESEENGEVVEPTKFTSLDDTLEMDKTIRDIQIDEPPQYVDTGFDDEMIQTSQFTGYSLDESQKFETKTSDAAQEDDFAKTQPLTSEEIREFEFDQSTGETSEVVEESVEEIEIEETIEDLESEFNESNEEPDSDVHDTIEEIEEEEPVETSEVELPAAETEETSDQTGELEPVHEEYSFNEVDEAVQEEHSEKTEEVEEESPVGEALETETPPAEDEIPLPDVASVLESDEDDLLELPPIESDYEDEFDEEEKASSTENADLATSETPSSSDQFSSELIEAIANRVMEKLSDKAVKEVAWEVVPQMTELIVKKMAEEKLKE